MTVAHHSPVPGHTHPSLRHSAWKKQVRKSIYLAKQQLFVRLTMENASVQREDTARISNPLAVGTKGKQQRLKINAVQIVTCTCR